VGMGLSPFVETLRARIVQRRLIRAADHVLAAVSGGADSVAMLLALHDLAPRLRYRLSVAHLNHGIRGASATKDATFVRHLCAQLETACYEGKVDVPLLASQHGDSLEMAARDARYRFLTDTARQVGATVVATAHTADDQAETLVLRLTRGTGLRGLAGIAEETQSYGVRVVRPLLHTTRNDIVHFLRDGQQTWRVDESNTDLRFLRNHVRHEILPFLAAKLNPRIQDALVRLSEIAADEDDWSEQRARLLMETCVRPDGALHVDVLRQQHPAARRRILLRWLDSSEVPSGQVGFDEVERLCDFVAAGGSGHALQLPSNFQVRIQGNALTLSHATARQSLPLQPRALEIPGVTCFPEAALTVTLRIARGVARQRHARLGQLPVRATLSLDALEHKTLILRTWQAGDRIRPLGMKGSRKLQDIFTDARVDALLRRTLPIVCAGKEIVWLPGYRIAAGWEVRDPTQPALQLRIARTGGNTASATSKADGPPPPFRPPPCPSL
jgi:tRNA(Ile)-lysidine synthase